MKTFTDQELQRMREERVAQATPNKVVVMSGSLPDAYPVPEPTYGEIFTLLWRTRSIPPATRDGVYMAPVGRPDDVLSPREWDFLVKNIDRILADEDLQERFRSSTDETNATFRRVTKIVLRRAAQEDQKKIEDALLNEQSQRASEAERSRAIALPCGHFRYLVELSSNLQTITCNHCGAVHSVSDVFAKTKREGKTSWFTRRGFTKRSSAQ